MTSFIRIFNTNMIGKLPGFKMNLLGVFLLCNLLFISCDKITDNIPEKLLANAGVDQTTIVGSYAIFDPTKSTGDFNWYEWKQDENNPQKIRLFSMDRQIKPELNINKLVFTKEGIYRFILICQSGVTASNPNGTSSSIPDTLIITVNSNPYPKFEDPNLEAIIRAKLNIQTAELDNNSLLNLDSLSNAEVIPLNSIVSLKGIELCTNLTYMKMGSQNISEISSLNALKKLKVLGLDQNKKITDITPLSRLENLQWLDLNQNLISDITPLKNLINLEYLNLQYNAITDISGLANLVNLKELYFSDTSLNDLSALSNLINLKVLWFNNCNLDNISYLKKLINITTLKIAWNKVQDLSSLSQMKKLSWIALEQNKIIDLSSLQNLPNIQYIRLWDNQISDIKPLVENQGIGKGDIVGLDGNPLNEKSIKEYIPILQNRGVIVTW
jgi:Leucine-rich repeat (LRR) protein